MTPLISAGGALLGVIIGGLLNWFVQRTAERRRQRGLVRAGVRLVDNDLRESKSNLERVDTGYWPQGLTLSTEVWRTYREALAVTLKNHDWEALSEAVAALDHVNAGLAKLPVGVGPQGAKVPEQLTNEIASARKLVDSALESCERLRQE